MIIWPVLGGSPFESVALEAGEQRLLVSYERYGPDSAQQLKDLHRIALERIQNQPRKEAPR